MIGTIRRHSQGLWWIIVVAVIVSFVWFYGASNASMETLFDGRRGAASELKVFGKPVSQSALTEARRNVEFGHFLQERSSQQRRPRTDEMLRTEVFQQVLVQRELAANAVIPGETAIAYAVRDQFKGSETGATADPKAGYAEFLKSLERTDFGEADFVSLMRNQVGFAHLRDVLTVPAALVPPREAMAEYRRDHELVTTSAVLFNPSNYLAGVVKSEALIGQYYTNNLARYRTEDKIGFNYVRFDASNHLAEAEVQLAKVPNLASSLQESYRQQTNQNPNAFLDAESRPLSMDAALVRVRAEALRVTALQLAFREAGQFYNTLGKQKVTGANFLAHAQTAAPSAAVVATPALPNPAFQPPFSEFRGAQEALSRLNPANPFSPPLDSKDSIVVAAYRERVPSMIQPFVDVQERVESEFVRQQSLTAARTAARAFLSEVTNAIAGGKSFTDVATARALKLVELPAFSAAMNNLDGLPDGVNLYELKNGFGSAQPGVVQLLDQGMPVVAVSTGRKPVADETVKAGLKAFTDELRQRRQFSVFNEWFRQKFEASGLAAVLTPKAPEAPAQ